MRDGLLRLGIPVIAIAIAGFQLFQAQINDQVAWEGGGFGMFATIDSQDSRRIATDPIVAPPSDLAARALVRPTTIEELAERLMRDTGRPVTVVISKIVYDDLEVSSQELARSDGG